MLKWTVKKRSDVQDLHQQRSTLPHEIFQDDQTATHERIHARRSLGNVLANQQLKNNSVNSPLNELKYHKRRSLGSQLVNNNRVRFDKENHVTSTPNNNRRHSINNINNNNNSLNKFNTTPLNDCSNLQRNGVSSNNKRKRQLFTATSPSSIFMDPPQTVVLAPTIYAPTLPSFDVEYSPHMKNNDHMLAVTDVFYETPRYFGNKMSSPQDELPAKRQKTSVQDLSYEFKAEPISASSPLVKTESTPMIKRDTKISKVLLNTSVSANSTFNSSNVGDVTLEKMIDAILASAKQNKKFRKQQKKALINKNLNNNDCHKNLNDAVCPEKTFEKPKPTIDLLITPEEIEKAADRTIIIEDKADQINEREVKSPIKADFEVVDDKTVDTCLLKRQKAVRRKNTSNENKNKKKNEDGKNKEISSNSNETSSTNKCLTFSPANNDEELSDKFKRSSMSSISSSCSSSSINRYTKNVLMKGSLELTISADDNKSKIYVHVVKCKNLQRSPENIINAYVKCALVSQNGSQVQQNNYQRTAVHRNSSCPIFDHKFIFNLNDCSDYAKRIQLAVWHRNRELKRSEFLGCMSIPVEHILEKSIHGTFLLQPQVCLTNPSPIIPEVDESKVLKENEAKGKCVKSDNLQLLRYLELEQNSMSTGRTAFTITKQMIRPAGGSFGFTITWMQPPKIEIVESNSPADLCGLMPGDHIVFVGNCNIVTMNELDILDLIMKQGDNLTFDVYRPTSATASHCPFEQLALLNTPVSTRNVSRSLPKDNSTDKSGKSIDLGLSICETPKKRPPVPKVAFNENVGSGVFV